MLDNIFFIVHCSKEKTKRKRKRKSRKVEKRRTRSIKPKRGKEKWLNALNSIVQSFPKSSESSIVWIRITLHTHDAEEDSNYI